MAGSTKYSPSQMEEIRNVPIAEVLIDLGYPVQSDSKGFIRSPFRNERTGSFKINPVRNVWCDFGESDSTRIRPGHQYAGGTVIDLVMLLRGCSVSEALTYLAELRGCHPEMEIERVKSIREYQSRGETRISKVGELYARTLKDYLSEERMIPVSLASRYCKQVYYKSVVPGRKEPEKDYFAIGFPNRSGAWIIRSRYTNTSTGEVQQVKRNIGQSDCTFIGKDGSFINDESLSQSTNVALFEGFINYLSWLAWKGVEIPGNTDIVVLNSITNAGRAFTFIARHANVYAYLDNDGAGDNCTENIRQMCEAVSDEDMQVNFHDCRSAYKGYNDLNDAWKEVYRCRRERGEGETQTEKKDVRMRR